MKNLKFKILNLISIIIFSFYWLYSGGTTAGNIVKLPVIASIVSRGDTGVAEKNFSGGVLYNPAVSGEVKHIEFIFSHFEYLIDTRYSSILFLYPSDIGGFGIFAGYMSSTNIPKTIIAPDEQFGFREEGDYGNYYITGMLSYGYRINTKLCVGFALRYISEQLVERKYVANGISIDSGLLYYPIRGLTLGLSVQNIGTGVKFIKDTFLLPIVLRSGLQYEIGRTVLSTEIQIDTDKVYRIKTGVELLVGEILYIMSGYNYSKTIEYLGITSGLSCGIGIKFAEYRLDYGIVPYSELGFAHRISLRGKF